jgi:hypothetical protein
MTSAITAPEKYQDQGPTIKSRMMKTDIKGKAIGLLFRRIRRQSIKII